jgi:hypothetical protein
MIVILHEKATERTCELVAKDLRQAFKGNVAITQVDAAGPVPWPGDVNWDDLLIVIYDTSNFPDAGNNYIADYLGKRDGKGLLLPVAIDPALRRPPNAAGAFKAFEFDAAASGLDGRLVRRVGAMLGLRVQQRDNLIFISYRASDGTAIAQQIEERLISLGYSVWRDEAKEIDGETTILPGSDVQQQIDQGLDRASIVLMLDTPDAPHSHWIKHEVDTANAQLLPILPLCLRTKADPKKGPRFRSLFDLQRWVSLLLQEPRPTPPLTDDDLIHIVGEMEIYLCEIFQRKCRVPFIVEKEFVSRNYSWQFLDRRLLMAESIRKSARIATRVFSHCSVFDQVHGAALDAFVAFLKRTGRPNYALYIYDGELIPEPELKEIIDRTPPDDAVVILHHQELAALIDSNFSTFTP